MKKERKRGKRDNGVIWGASSKLSTKEEEVEPSKYCWEELSIEAFMAKNAKRGIEGGDEENYKHMK